MDSTIILDRRGTADGPDSSDDQITHDERRVVEIAIQYLDDPVQFACMASALVNPTRLALVQASVDNAVVYPASPEAPTKGSVIQLRFRTRNPADAVTEHDIDRLVAVLGSVGVVIRVDTNH